MLGGSMTTCISIMAFGFVSPALLGWLGLALAPILIHWLFRRRGREVRWAAMQFLVEAARKQSRRARWERLILLATRVLILVALVLALAQPRWSADSDAALSSPPTLRVIVLDASLSMGRMVEGQRRTLLEIAKSFAHDVVNQASEGDRFALIRLAGSEPRLIVRQPTLSRRAILDEIDRLSVTFERGDVPATLPVVAEVLKHKLPNEKSQVVVLSDWQADNWQSVVSESPPVASESRIGLADIVRQAELVRIDLGTPQPGNVTLAAIEVPGATVVENEPMLVRATVRSSDSTTPRERKVSLFVDDQWVNSQQVMIEPDQNSVVELRWAHPIAGDHVAMVRLEEDSLRADNQRWLTLRVRSQWRVLLVNGRPASVNRDAATFFVEQALAPRRHDVPRSQDIATEAFVVTTIPDSDFSNHDLNAFDVVFLCETNQLLAADVSRLRAFLQRGGGVILSLGANTSLDRCNQTLLGPDRLMNLQLTKVVSATDDARSVEWFGFDPGDWSHDLLRDFRGNPGAGLEAALVRKYAGVEIDQGQSPVPSVAIVFTTGEPAILTQTVGRGRSVLVTTSLDESWGAWPIWAPGFVPLIHELVRFASADDPSRHRLLVAEPLIMPWPSVAETVILTQPDGTQRQVSTTRDGDETSVVIHETLQPGVLTISSEPPLDESLRVAVNFDPRESDPEVIARSRLQPERQFVSEPTLNTEPVTFITGNVQSSRWLLGVALVLLLVEQGLAWRFSAGAVIAVAALAVCFSTIQPLVTLVLLSLIGIGVVFLRHRIGFARQRSA